MGDGAVIETPEVRVNSAAKLAQSVLQSEKKMQPFRDQRVKFMRHFAGPYYGENDLGMKWRQVLNIVFMLAATLEPSLALRRLMTDVHSRSADLRWFAEQLRLVLDDVILALRVPLALRAAVRDSLYAAGILTVGYSPDAAAENGGLPYFVDHVSFDDWIIDRRSKVRRPGSYAWEGHRFRVSHERMRENIPAAARDVFDSLLHSRPKSAERGEDIAANQQNAMDASEEYDPQVELVQVYDPAKRMCLWLPGDLEATTMYLREFPWEGPPDDPFGPYEVMGFHWLNDNPVPVALIGVIFDLYLLENVIAVKMGAQAEAQKDFAVAQKGTGDGDAIRDVQDGQVIELEVPDKTDVKSMGGPNKRGYEIAGWLHDWVNRVAGNPDILGGLSADSETLGQDQLKFAQASVRLNDMRETVQTMCAAVVRKLAWYIWNDSDFRHETTQQVYGVPFPVIWTPRDWAGTLGHYQLGVNVYARQVDSAEDQYARLVRLVGEVIGPLLGIAAQQGSRLDVDLLVNRAGQLLGIPEIEDLWLEGEPIENPAMAGTPGKLGSPSPRPKPTMRQGSAKRPVEAMAERATETEA